MRKLSKALAAMAVCGVVLYSTGAAADLSSVTTKLASVFEEIKTVFFVLSAFGLIGLAAAALLGKVQWKWLFALVFGVAIVGAAGYIVSYAAGKQGGIDGITDTTFDGGSES